MDFEIITQTVCGYLCMAKNLHYLPDGNKRYDIAYFPSIHHMYSGRLKIGGYEWLNKKEKLFVFAQGDGDNITIYNDSIDFMGKKWLLEENFVFNISKKYGISLENSLDYFNFIEDELPGIRLIKDVNNLYFFKVGKKYKKTSNLLKLLYELSQLGNIIFLSNLHENLPLENCIQQDNDLFQFKGKNDIYLLKIFFKLSDYIGHKPKIVGYENTEMIDGNISKTTGYCVIVC